MRLRQPEHVGQLCLERREFLGDVAGASSDLCREVREQQRERALGEAFGELVQPGRQRVRLALAGQLAQELRVEGACSGQRASPAGILDRRRSVACR